MTAVQPSAVIRISSGPGFNSRNTRQVRRKSAARFRVVIMTETVMPMKAVYLGKRLVVR